ncbi:MAG TPA: protein phosphatase 2C domain-containing protein [Kofleriaceae bacterium]|jgi:hypothetical protein|nr:protein phosphatase 2C domain-containing protein [Kofleriaceae bacterium]
MTRINCDAAIGVVAGREHRRSARNGQDAAALRLGRTTAVAVVADGCGSAPRSEVGAELGARLCAAAALAALEAGAPATDPATWTAVGDRVRAALIPLTAAAGVDLAGDCLLFTLVGAALTADAAVIFALGDGHWAIDGVAHSLGPFVDNAPPYLMQERGALALVAATDATELIVATDGADPIDLPALAADPLVWRNPDGLRRRLARLAADDLDIDWDARAVRRTVGPLTDDCAVAMLRRRP